MDQPKGRAGIDGMSLYSATGFRKYLTVGERRRFFKALQGLPPKERLFCLVLAWSGGRISEVLALKAESIDIESGTVAIETLKRRKRGLVRHVPLPPELLRSLAKGFQLRARQRDPSFSRERLWPWARVTGWRCVKRAMLLAGVRGLAATSKGLRHTFGVNAFETAVPPHLVQRWLGHASLKTTSIYGDVIGPEERKIANRMWQGHRGR